MTLTFNRLLTQAFWLFFSFWLSIKVHSCGWLNCTGGIWDIFTKVSASQTRTSGENAHFKTLSVKTWCCRVFIKSSVKVSWKVSFFHQHFKLDYRLELCHLQCHRRSARNKTKFNSLHLSVCVAASELIHLFTEHAKQPSASIAARWPSPLRALVA